MYVGLKEEDVLGCWREGEPCPPQGGDSRVGRCVGNRMGGTRHVWVRVCVCGRGAGLDKTGPPSEEPGMPFEDGGLYPGAMRNYQVFFF